MGFRKNSLGDPFRNKDSGVDETLDPENFKLYKEGIKNYLDQLEKTQPLDRSMLSTFHNWSGVFYPGAVGFLSYAVMRNYTRPGSMYFRGIWSVFGAGVGYWCALKAQTREQDIFMLKNYKFFGQEMRDALATGDSRYLRHYHSGAQV